MKHVKKKKKIEWSKKLCGLVAFFFGAFALWCGWEYYQLVREAISLDSSVMPDATLAVTAMSVVVGALLSYLLYQMGLKNSRNKYGVDEEGNPYRVNMADTYEETEENSDDETESDE